MFFYSVLGLVLYFTFLIGVSSIGPNPITLNHKIPGKNDLSKLAPQGWAFFTKDIRKDFFKIYKKNEENGTYEKVKIKSSSIDQLFGIKRNNRSIMHKISYIIKNVDKNLWYTHRGDPNKINRDSLSVVSIVADEPMIYGEFLIAKGEPIPYEWSKSKLNINPELEHILINLKK